MLLTTELRQCAVTEAQLAKAEATIQECKLQSETRGQGAFAVHEVKPFVWWE
jgi:hypothetical protein